MTGFGQDVCYSLRMLAKTRGFTAIAVATLALGIGANSAILTLGGKMFYRTPPYKDPLGKQVELLRSTMKGDEEIKPGLRTIIGIVPVVRRIAYWAKPFPQAHVPFEQNPVPSILH